MEIKIGSNFVNNPIFKPMVNNNIDVSVSGTITSIDVEVEYLGKFDLDLNWIRFETPNLQKITRGAYDQQVYASVMDAMNNGFGNSSANTSNSKFFRFYNDDELITCQYEMSRYINLLLDTNVSTETFYTNNPDDAEGMNFIPHFFYGTGYKQFWSGSNLTATINSYIAAPYYRIENSGLEGSHFHPEIFDIDNGYLGYAGKFLNTGWVADNNLIQATLLAKDTINSMYETHFLDLSSANSNTIGSHYPIPSYSPFSSTQSYLLFDKGDRLSYSSFQQRIDGFLATNFKNSPQAYYNNEHWVNVWLGLNFGLANAHTSSSLSPLYTTITVGYDGVRPATGEELRLSLYSEMIKGVKGFIVWQTVPTYHYSNSFSFLNGTQGSIFDIDGNNTSASYTYFGGVQSGSSSSSSYNLIYSNDIGSDFINTVTSGSLTSSTFDSDFYHQFYQPQELGIKLSNKFYDFAKLYVKPSRVYIGRKSQRIELYKTFNFIHENENLLLNIDLLAYKNKGFISFSNKNPNSALSINDFIDTINIKTRPIGRVKDDKVYYENEAIIDGLNIDSAFYEVSILSSPSSMTMSNPSGSFCLAVVNRRSDPLIRNYLYDGENVHNEMQFYTTAEYDENCIKTTNTKDIYGVDRNPEWWRAQWWSRLGCREISIPMKIKYKDNNGIEKYALLKVTELKGNEIPIKQGLSSTTLSSSAQNEIVDSLYPKVDKVIGQDGSIVANYLPGEGKIFRIEILPPAELTGKLDNINQNKMVSMPVYSSGTMTNKVVYYATYYEYHNQHKKNVVRLAISQPIDKNSQFSDIVWYNSFSSTVSDFLNINGNIINPNSSGTFFDSYHPTIAVRQDWSNPNLHSIFILYSVRSMLASDLITIAESKYTFNPSSMTVTKDYNHGISSVQVLSTQSGIDWGTPTINSSKDVLFYAWSGRSIDSLIQGIFYTVKKPYELGVGLIKCIRETLFPDRSINTTMLHPSLNTYSTTVSKFSHDNYATLVWDQDLCTNGQLPDRRLIYMTTLFYDSLFNNLGYYLLPMESSSTFKNGVYFYDNNNIVKFNWGGSAGIYPSVYSNLAYTNYIIPNEKVSDYIVFERKWSNLSRIFLLPIGTVNSFHWDVAQPLITIMSRRDFANITQPVIKQPSSIFSSLPPTFKQSRVLLNFKFESYLNPIYQFSMDEGLAIGSLVLDNNYWKGVYSSSNNIYDVSKIANDANQNHLAASPIINFDPTAWKNRRIFETGTNTLLTSARYFYKQNQDGLEIQNYFGYTTDTTSFYIGEINRDNDLLPMKLPYNINLDSINGNTISYNNADSIYSDWFTVNSTSTIDFKLGGRNPLNSNIFIQRRDSNSIHNVPVLLLGDDSMAVLVNLMLINGNGKDYRLVIVKSDTLDIYQEQIVLGGKPILDTLYFKSNKSNVTLIDLNGRATMSGGNDLILNVTPNPAENEAYAIAYIPNEHLLQRQTGENKLLLSLYNSIGLLIKEVNCVSGETVKFDLRELGNGNYFVKAREKAETYYELCKPTQKSLLIKR